MIFGGDQAGQIDPKQLAGMRHRLGIDQPPIAQFGTWLWGVLRLDFGTSPPGAARAAPSAGALIAA